MVSVDEQDGRKKHEDVPGGPEWQPGPGDIPAPRAGLVKDLAKAKGSVPVDLRTNAVAGKDCVYCVGDVCGTHSFAGVPIGRVGVQGWLALGKRLAALVRGEEAALPSEVGAVRGRDGRRTGWCGGANLTLTFADPENGKPAFAIEPHADGTAAKVA